MSDYFNEDDMPEPIKSRVKAGAGCGSFFGKGWLDIVLKLDEDISKIDPNYVIDQVKEKFGGLRYYVTLSENITEEQRVEIYEFIHEVEFETSFATCDICGKPGQIGNVVRGYVATRCEEHAKYRPEAD